MKCNLNVGGWDRALRILVGLLLLVGKLAGLQALAGTAGTVLAIVGLVLLFSGVVGSCPLYSLSGLSTNRK